MHQTHQLLNSW